MVRVVQHDRPETLRCPRCMRSMVIARYGDIKFAYCWFCGERCGWVHDWNEKGYEWK